MTVYQELKNANLIVEEFSYKSDVYVKDCPEAWEILNKPEHLIIKKNTNAFRCQRSGDKLLDIPFINDSFWSNTHV